MEFAGEGLISLESSKDWESFRLTSPRSDLSRHQSHINLRNLSAIHSLWFVNLLRSSRHVTLFVRPIVSQQRPDRARHLVRERHHRRIERPARKQLLEPGLALLAVGGGRGGARDSSGAQENKH